MSRTQYYSINTHAERQIRVQDFKIINNWMLPPMIVNRRRGNDIGKLVTLSTNLYSDRQCPGSLEMLANLHSSPFEPRNSDISSGMDDESNNYEMVNSGLEIPIAGDGHTLLASALVFLATEIQNSLEVFSSLLAHPRNSFALSTFMLGAMSKEYRRQSGNDDNGSTFSNVVNPNDFCHSLEPKLEEILEDIG
ncbi:hypothetical protein AAG906_035137 [Vitis piasezkii]